MTDRSKAKPRMTNPLTLGKRMKPTLQHRPAVWEAMLATVYAQNEAGEVKYFDYDWDGAVAFAGVAQHRDLRTFKAPASRGEIRKGQYVLYVKKK